MGIKHLLGFFLIISGFGIGMLVLFFMFNSQFYSDLFLAGLGFFAFFSFISGVFILNKNN